jgi:hypothetical protein
MATYTVHAPTAGVDTIAVTVNHSRHHLNRDHLATALLMWWDTNPDASPGQRLYWVAHRLRREEDIDPIPAWILARAAEVCADQGIEP